MIDLNLNPSRKELKWFAGGLIIFFSFVAWVVYNKTGSAPLAYGIAGTAAVLGIVGVFFPAFIRYVYVPWMIAVYPIGWTVSTIVMAAIFYLLVTPIGVLMRLSGRDPMHKSFDPTAKSYWIERPKDQGSKRYFRQF